MSADGTHMVCLVTTGLHRNFDKRRISSMKTPHKAEIKLNLTFKLTLESITPEMVTKYMDELSDTIPTFALTLDKIEEAQEHHQELINALLQNQSLLTFYFKH